MFLLMMKQQQKSTNRSEVNDNIYLNCNNIVFLKVLINKAKNAVSPKKKIKIKSIHNYFDISIINLLKKKFLFLYKSLPINKLNDFFFVLFWRTFHLYLYMILSFIF